MIKCLQRQLAWCNHSGMKFDPGNEQYSVFPRALSDENGVPHKAPKRHWTDKLQDRYKNMQRKVFTNDLLNAWLLPHYSVILDAMFLINTKPLRSTKTVTDYLQLIYSRFVKEYFSSGACDVHIIFDSPSSDGAFNPKMVEQLRRDTGKKSSRTCSLLISLRKSTSKNEMAGCD